MTEHANCMVMAHNFQGYDSYFVLQYLGKQCVKYDVIMQEMCQLLFPRRVQQKNTYSL